MSDPQPKTCDLPAGSSFSSWPPPLLATLCLSYQAHGSGNHYLDNSFWGGTPPNFEEALNRLGPAGQKAVKWVYERAAPISGLWPLVKYVHNVWATDSHGFAFTTPDRGVLRKFLDASSSFCRDTPVMMSDHQAASPAQCWREIVTGGPGLHICIPVSDSQEQTTVAGECNMHIDPHQLVKSKDTAGVCNYSAAGVVGHAKDVGAGVVRRMGERALKSVEQKLEELGKALPDYPRW